jgi:hypothetical protein
MASSQPFTSEDEDVLTRVAADREFTIVLAPWKLADGDGLLDRIARSTTAAELVAATADPLYDFRPPTDRRPYYFNMLRPRAILETDRLPGGGGALNGNLRATLMLLTLLGVCTTLVCLIIVWPLIRSGRPPMPAGQFAVTMGYFAVIGFAYMLIQIGLLQRLSIYIGHPTYTLAIVLFSMLLFTGLGSFLSQALSVSTGTFFRWVPIAITLALGITAIVLPRVLAATVTSGLATRTLCVLAFAAPLSTLLGMCFPIGVRLVERASAVVPWAWGINGAFGVLAAIVGVAISMWVEIDANFWIAAVLYFVLSGLLVKLDRYNARGT